jgi:phosphoglycerol transferase MdoB-like AlkP superfamily enzyme
VKEIIKRFIFLFFFWILVFFAGRVVFFIITSSFLSGVTFTDLLGAFYHGIRLDWSMTGYFFVPPFLLWSLYIIFPKQILLKVIDGTNIFLMALYSLTVAGESCLYREWKSKLSMQALLHFKHPAEVFRSASWGLTILFLFLSGATFILFFILYRKKISFSKGITYTTSSWKRSIALGVLFLFFSESYAIIAIRGGVQPIPISIGDAYFSRDAILNDAAANPFWNICYSVKGYYTSGNTNPYAYFSSATAKGNCDKLFKMAKDSTVSFLSNTRPNIVFIILESWSADCISSFGGGNFAPFMDSLCSKGIYFDHVFSAGFSSDQGIPAVLSSYPSTSNISITHQNSKSAQLPGLNQDLKKLGYESGFIFGGDLNYGNIKSYLYNIHLDKVIEEKDISTQLPRGRLGVQDEYMATEYLNAIGQMKEPFLYYWFTLSSHMPYDFSLEKRQLVDHKENNYINSIVYTDRALRLFFNSAKKQAWYKNTLFVLVSDHSHATNMDRDVLSPAYHRIPCVLFGEVIGQEFRGKKIAKTFSQLDIIPTLLCQMGLKEQSKQYAFGKNMFDPFSKNFAYTCNPSGATFIFDTSYVGFQHASKEVIKSNVVEKPLADSLYINARSLQQIYFEDYLSR